MDTSRDMDGDVLLTGANGYLGFHILLDLLKLGFAVRAAVQSPAKAEFIFRHPLIRRIHPAAKLSVIIVPDIKHPAAYEQAVIGITYVLHVASPRVAAATANLKESLLEPALKGTVRLLTAALQSRTIKRVIITSSFLANRQLGTPSDIPTTPQARVPNPHGPFDRPYQAYAASKIITLNAADVFFNEMKPHFDIFSIMPGHILGRNELARNTDELITGSNRIALGHLVQKPFLDPKTVHPRVSAHLDDVVKVHIEALFIKAKGRQSFAVGAPADWNSSFAIAERHFPEAVRYGVFHNTVQVKGVDFPCDASETERVFGMKIKNYEEQVTAVAAQYLELRGL